MQILLLESDRVVANCIKRELEKQKAKVHIIAQAEEAIAVADEHTPDAVIAEISLPGHSATEFFYEFRTYPDWKKVPIIIYSSMQLPERAGNSQDWKLLNISETLYKPDISIAELCERVSSFAAV